MARLFDSALDPQPDPTMHEHNHHAIVNAIAHVVTQSLLWFPQGAKAVWAQQVVVNSGVIITGMVSLIVGITVQYVGHLLRLREIQASKCQTREFKAK